MADNRFALDPDLADMCDDAAAYPSTSMAAWHTARELTTGIPMAVYFFALAMRLVMTPVLPVYTGYMPKTERTDFAARTYRDALATPPARETAADRALAEARAWGLAS